MFVHSSRLRKQVEYLHSKGIRTEGFIKQAGISQEQLLDPEQVFSIEQYQKLLEFATEKTGDIHYGLNLGTEPHIAGTVGMMCASCKNLKEAFVQGCKYFRVQGDFAAIEFIEDKRYPFIRYSPVQSWQLSSPSTARHDVDAMFAFLVTIMKVNSNNSVLPHRINLVCDQPDEMSEYKRVFGKIPHFLQSENEMIFRQQDLMVPMKAFNPETFALLSSHINAQLKRFGGEMKISDRVRTIFLSSARYSFPGIDAVASRLNMSSRTLQRLLSTEKTSYKALLQDTRFDLARQLLKQKDLTISEISYLLGYSDLGNFSRSFKKYMGLSPQEFRLSVIS